MFYVLNVSNEVQPMRVVKLENKAKTISWGSSPYENFARGSQHKFVKYTFSGTDFCICIIM
jgi:hypothetical protein